MTLDDRDCVSRENDTPFTAGPRPDTPTMAETLMSDLIATGLRALTSAGRAGPRVDVVAPRDEDPAVLTDWATFGLPKYEAEDPPDWPRRRLAELLPTDGALGDFLEHLPPGERLARFLAAIDNDRVDDYSLVEVVAAYKRMEAWSAAQAARTAAALAERDALNPTWPGAVPGRTRGECVAGEELAMRLRVSRLTAIRMVGCGRAFGQMFQPTGAALNEGLIDFPRAQAIVSTLEGLPTDVAMAAQWEVLDKAPGRTLRQVHQDLAKAVIAVDPDAADARHRTARQKRCVHRPRALPDGMAHVSATLPAADAIALDLALEAAARAAKNNGDTRTFDQLRADSLALMGHTALAFGHIGPHAGARCSCGCATAGTGSPTVDDGGPATPAQAPGAADAVPSPGDARTAMPSQTSADAAATEGAASSPPPVADSAAAGPDHGPPATGAGPDHRPPATGAGPDYRPPATGETSPGIGTGSASPPSPPTQPSDTGPPQSGHRLPGGCLPTIRLGTLGGGRTDIRITVPLGVLLPDPDAPLQSPLERLPEPVAELEGYGPIPPVIARALAAGGVWRRLVTDPVSGQVLDVGRTRYQPTAAIADHVRERDRTCARPGCSCSARNSDLDHEHEWQDGGVTSAENLEPLCGRDHIVKSIGAYTVAHGSDRTYAWAGAIGHGYLRRPDGTIVTMPRRSAQSLRALGREAAKSRRSVDPQVVDAILAEIAAGTDVGGSWTGAHSATTHPWPGVEDGPTWGTDVEPPF